MSKKIIFKPKNVYKSPIPDDVEAKIDAWIAKDTSTPTPTPPQEIKTQELPSPPPELPTEPAEEKKEVRINFNVSHKLHTELKLMCVRKGISIKDLCIDLLMDELKRNS
jgi:hypothetical protein